MTSAELLGALRALSVCPELLEELESHLRPDPLPSPELDQQFERFWQAYPKRQGCNPKAPAKALFAKIISKGDDPEDLIHGALLCQQAERSNVGTPYIPQAVKWLRDRRWCDYLAQTRRGSQSAANRISGPSTGHDSERGVDWW